MLRLSLITQLTIWCFTLSVITQQGLESSDGRSSNTKTSADKPNVLFIAVDDLRPELGCYGVDYIQTPRIDAFAKTGRLFRNHYVTAPSCGPSRYALLINSLIKK